MHVSSTKEAIGLKSEGEIENWKLLCAKNERGKGFDNDWFCKNKIGISRRHIDRMIEVNDNYKKCGFNKIQVDKIGIKGVSELMTKYSGWDTGVPTEEINILVAKRPQWPLNLIMS